MADQDWGIKDSDNTTSLLSPIYGYSLSEEDNATFPGPTIVTSKDCPVHIEFHNNLGIGQHMFEIDRSINCETAVLNTSLCESQTIHGGTPLPPLPPGVDDEFFCRCVSEHGSERRTTVSMTLKTGSNDMWEYSNNSPPLFYFNLRVGPSPWRSRGVAVRRPSAELVHGWFSR
jgi:hypothetical protein